MSIFHDPLKYHKIKNQSAENPNNSTFPTPTRWCCRCFFGHSSPIFSSWLSGSGCLESCTNMMALPSSCQGNTISADVNIAVLLLAIGWELALAYHTKQPKELFFLENWGQTNGNQLVNYCIPGMPSSCSDFAKKKKKYFGRPGTQFYICIDRSTAMFPELGSLNTTKHSIL